MNKVLSGRWILVFLLVAVLAGLPLIPSRSARLLAQSSDWVAEAIQSSSGGMAQYGAAELTASSASADLTAVTNWNTYINSRSAFSFSSSQLNSLATADYNARRAGQPTITAQQIATAATSIINSTLSTMSASQQAALFTQNIAVSVPNGKIYVNNPDPNVTATESSSGTWTVTVSATEFSNRKTFFQTYAPGMVSTYANFYPGEAVMVTYSLATGDLGYDSSFIESAVQGVANATGVSMSSNLLYGTNGYLVRRPLSTFLTSTNINQFFTDLGF
jgi:hypothetical protein